MDLDLRDASVKSDRSKYIKLIEDVHEDFYYSILSVEDTHGGITEYDSTNTPLSVGCRD